MGRKTNPNIIRVGNMTHNWDGRWFASRRSDFRRKLTADLKMREYFLQKHRLASISRIEVERGQQEMVLTIHTSRPAMVIGRGGSGIEQIQKDLVKILRQNKKIRINVQEVRNPDTDAVAMATQVVEQIERRFAFRRVLKQAVARAMQAGALGVKVEVSGRLNGAEIARSEWLAEGNVPLHTFRADVAFAKRVAFTTYGTIGVKVWINRGELKIGVKTEPEVGEPRRGAGQSARQTSLAERAKKSVRVKPKAEVGKKR